MPPGGSCRLHLCWPNFSQALLVTEGGLLPYLGLHSYAFHYLGRSWRYTLGLVGYLLV